ncbi:MAG TPA: methyltransferase domain-containing protein [Gaiellales bacterium]|nr:methyltransferase domain-containing protein [Gaiellales bacterium]
MAEPVDRWARWLGERRFGGDEEMRARAFADLLIPLRDRVLNGAEPIAGATVLDVGCGDGLIAFGALDRGAAGVVFADISRDLLGQCRQLAAEAGVGGRCRFVETAAENLAPIETASVDVVTARSVLIYVAEKAAAFREFARVLRPGGRLSIFEPINSFSQREWTGSRFFGVDLAPLGDIAAKVLAPYREAVPADDPMLDFDERDLLSMAEDAGFFPLDLTLTADLRPADARPWNVFLHSAGNPNLPTLAEAMDRTLTGEEQAELTRYLRPLIEHGAATRRMAHAYLRARRR